MPDDRRTLPIALLTLLLLALGGGIGAAVLLADPDDRGRAASGPAAPAPGPATPAPGPTDLERIPEAGPEQAEVEGTTVLFPLEVTLELLSADRLPVVDGGQPTSLGRVASLKGSAYDRRGNPVPVEVEFLAGPNQGRVLHAASDGRFGASDLYPGLELVEIRGAGLLTKRREVRLRDGAETDLNVSDFRPASVLGAVRDEDGQPVDDAEVRFDGQVVRTDQAGEFMLLEVAAGKVVVEVSKPGYAAYREQHHLSIGTTYTQDKFQFVLRPASTLELNLPDAVGGPGDAYVLIYPTRTNVARTFPWYTVNPVRVAPGTMHTIEGLPEGMVSVRVFHGGAAASPQEKAVNLRAGEVHRMDVGLRPAAKLTGVVRRDGQPAANATVRLEAPNRTATTLGFFRESALFLESEVLAPIPPAVQEVRTDALGRFVLTAWSDITPTRWLEATSSDGEAWAGRLVEPADEDLVLDLRPLDAGTGVLALVTDQRTQGIDLEVTVNGERREPRAGLPSWERIRIGGLEPGTWRVRARWNVEEVLPSVIVEVPAEGEAEVECTLPRAAVEGQDRDTWKRAGRTYPSR